MDPNITENLLYVKKKAEPDLLSKANVVAVGIAPKNGTGEMAIAVFVKRKVKFYDLFGNDPVPPEIDGYKTDVIESGELVVHATKERPVFGGISAIHYKGTACTLGAIVYKDGKSYALTNSHCANPYWMGAKLGDAFLQPSPTDGGKQTDIIGYVKETLPLSFDLLNTFDASLVELSVEAKKLWQDVIGSHLATPATLKLDEEVQKTGRTTGFQKSKVMAMNVTAVITYGKGLVATFENQVFCYNDKRFFSAPGDSGSLILNMQGNPVGLNFAGSDVVEIMNPIMPILNYYKCSFDNKPAYVFTIVLKRGMRGVEVKSAQEALIKNGANIKADSVFGTQTAQAVYEFQKSNGLVADKIIGPITGKRLSELS